MSCRPSFVICALGLVACTSARPPRGRPALEPDAATYTGVHASAPASDGAPPVGAQPEDAGRGPDPAPVVQVYGSLYELMHAGKVGPVVALARLTAPHLYAVGALSELRGEVTIVDGARWLSYPDAAGGTRIDRAGQHEQVTLLVAAQVERWRPIEIDRELPSAELDRALEALVVAAGLDATRRIPMRIEGPVAELAWHVLGGRAAGGLNAGDHHDHRQGAITGSLTSERATLVGFFSKSDQGVFTHMGSSTHLHVVDDAHGVAGHVDAVTVGKGAVLYVPAS
jgi:hypothetical protein